MKCMCIDMCAHQILQCLIPVFHSSSLIPKDLQFVLSYISSASSSILGEITRINHDVGVHSFSIRFVTFFMKISQLIQKLNLTNIHVRAHIVWFSFLFTKGSRLQIKSAAGWLSKVFLW